MNVLIVCHAGSRVGLGHLTRSLAVARILRQAFDVSIRFLIQGEPIAHPELQQFEHDFLPIGETLAKQIEWRLEKWVPQLIIFDLFPEWLPIDMAKLLINLRAAACKIIAVDSLLSYRDHLDLIVMPSFRCPPEVVKSQGAPLIYGWDCFLLNAKACPRLWRRGSHVLVLSGGADVTGLGQRLPRLLLNILPDNAEVNWVTGPYAKQPDFPESSTLTYNNHHAPSSLDELMLDAHYAVTVYGVSFFELLYYGIPTVVFSPYGNKDDKELGLIAEENIALVARDEFDALEKLRNLMANDEMASALSIAARNKMVVANGGRLVQALNGLLA